MGIDCKLSDIDFRLENTEDSNVNRERVIVGSKLVQNNKVLDAEDWIFHETFLNDSYVATVCYNQVGLYLMFYKINIVYMTYIMYYTICQMKR